MWDKNCLSRIWLFSRVKLWDLYTVPSSLFSIKICLLFTTDFCHLCVFFLPGAPKKKGKLITRNQKAKKKAQKTKATTKELFPSTATDKYCMLSRRSASESDVSKASGNGHTRVSAVMMAESDSRETLETISRWVFPKIMGTPKSSIFIGFSIINHPFWGTPIFGNTQMGPVIPRSLSRDPRRLDLKLWLGYMLTSWQIPMVFFSLNKKSSGF